MLPFGLELDTSKPITFDFPGTSLSNVTDDGAYLTGFNLAGTGTITGTLVPVPVPAAVWLFGSGMLSLWLLLRVGGRTPESSHIRTMFWRGRRRAKST